MTEIICTLITALAGIIVAILTVKINKQEANAKERESIRQEESLLSLRMMDATLQLSVVTSNALTGGTNNGNVETARKAAKDVAHDYQEFMQRITAHEVGR